MTKQVIEHASELRGVLIVAREEGAQLGTVSGINIDAKSKAISAIRFRAKSGRGESYVAMKNVQLIGRDVVIVSDEGSVKNSEDIAPPGTNLEDLQGAWVTTLQGKNLGTLVDVDFRPGDWMISELTLSDGKSLAVDPTEITIGDAILVPPNYEERIVEMPEQPGVMSRIFGSDNIERMKTSLTRALRTQKDTDEKPDSDNETHKED